MAGVVRRTRARQRDRDDALDGLSAAYGDGQITEDQHEQRVAAVIRATQLAELAELLDDLQLRPGPAHDLVERVHKARRAERESKAPPAPLKVALMTLGGLAVLIVVITAVAIWSGDDSTDRLDMRTEENLSAMVEAVDDEFGSTEVIRAEISETNTSVVVSPEAGRYETWYFSHKGFEEYEPGRGATNGEAELVDLDDLDTGRLLDNIETAYSSLGIDEVDNDSVTIVAGPVPERVDGSQRVGQVDGHVMIRVFSPYSEVGILYTDLQGRVLVEDPYRAS